MHRKITGNLLSVGSVIPNPDDCITIRVINRELIVTPYQAGDENREEVVIRSPDSRGRVRIPSGLLQMAGIKDYVDIVREQNGTIHITPLAAKKIGLRRKNA